MPIGSMYGIYAIIWGILMINVTIYTIHGSYGNGQWSVVVGGQNCYVTADLNGDSLRSLADIGGVAHDMACFLKRCCVGKSCTYC